MDVKKFSKDSSSPKKRDTKKVNKFDLLEAQVDLPNKVFKALRRNASFFEDDPNYLYEYVTRIDEKLKKIDVDMEAIQLKKNKTKLPDEIDLNNPNLNFDKIGFKVPNENDDLQEYKENLMNLVLLKKQLKNDQFLIRQESNRFKDLGQNVNENKIINPADEDKKYAGEEKKDADFLENRKKNRAKALYGVQDDKNAEEENVKKFIEITRQRAEENKKNQGNLKLMQIYSQKEIKDYYKFKNKVQQRSNVDKDEKETQNNKFSKDELFARARNEISLLNNNVILFKPTIFKSKKQQHYEMAEDGNVGSNQINLLMKNKVNFKDLEENEVRFRIENLEKKVRDVEMKNYMEKLEKLDNINLNNNNKNIKQKNLNGSAMNRSIIFNKDDPENLEDSFDEEEEVVQVKIVRDVSFCEKVMNFFLGDPHTSYAFKKHHWGGENRIFGRYFQDTRVFGEEYGNQIAGKNTKKKKKVKVAQQASNVNNESALDNSKMN